MPETQRVDPSATSSQLSVDGCPRPPWQHSWLLQTRFPAQTPLHIYPESRIATPQSIELHSYQGRYCAAQGALFNAKDYDVDDVDDVDCPRCEMILLQFPRNYSQTKLDKPPTRAPSPSPEDRPDITFRPHPQLLPLTLLRTNPWPPYCRSLTSFVYGSVPQAS